jgi:hypothetical protein
MLMRKRWDEGGKNRYRRVLLFAFLLSTVIPGPAVSGSPRRDEAFDPFDWNRGNLLTNGGFEEAGPDLIPKGWVAGYQREGFRIAVSSEALCSGRYALKITSPEPNDVWLAQRVRVKPNTNYRFSGWILTRNVGPAGRIGANFSLIAPGFYHSPDITGNSIWLYTEINFRTHSRQKEVTVAVRLGRADTPAAGAAYFDQVSLVELDGPPPPDHPHRYLFLSPADFPQERSGPFFWVFLAVFVAGAAVLLTGYSRTRQRRQEK